MHNIKSFVESSAAGLDHGFSYFSQELPMAPIQASFSMGESALK